MLLSDSELAAIQDIAHSGLKSSVAIYHGSRTKTDGGQSWAYPTTPDVTTIGWLYEMTPSSAKLNVIDGQTAISETHRLFLTIGTDCRSGDKVVVAGTAYTVQHTNAGDTYPATMSVYMRVQQ